ncbi:hypothetical protein [Psychrobacillus sp. L4]|uniref:hypothetical protein n=1 Tax=Psychrobacillus sp. L4 TaxID=3236892 RepID=UPI0036F2FA4E
MSSPHKLIRFVQKARLKLAIEHYIRMLQAALFVGFSSAAAILLVSRLFIFPYYIRTAVIVGVIGFVAVFLYAFWIRPSKEYALQKLDSFFPDNIFVTALSFLPEKSALAKGLLEKTELESKEAFGKFKQREKHYFQPKWILGCVLAFTVVLVLSAFPAATQLEAKDIEKEHQIVNEMKKEIEKQEKKQLAESIKKDLKELKEKLKEVDTAVEALREVVKKQKELALKEQKLEKKKELSEQEGSTDSSLTAEEQKELASLEEVNNTLAKSASSIQTALSKMGKSFPFTASQIAQGNSISTNNDKSNSGKSEAGKEEEADSGESKGNGEKGQSQGKGQGSGNGQGKGQGQGQGAGKGSGGRDLLSIPSRIGGTSETTVDGGKLGEGEAASQQPGEVPVTRGSAKPYGEVVNEYSDSYLKSSERMQLPTDLQRLIQNYFSSVENKE